MNDFKVPLWLTTSFTMTCVPVRESTFLRAIVDYLASGASVVQLLTGLFNAMAVRAVERRAFDLCRDNLFLEQPRDRRSSFAHFLFCSNGAFRLFTDGDRVESDHGIFRGGFESRFDCNFKASAWLTAITFVLWCTWDAHRRHQSATLLFDDVVHVIGLVLAFSQKISRRSHISCHWDLTLIVAGSNTEVEGDFEKIWIVCINRSRRWRRFLRLDNPLPEISASLLGSFGSLLLFRSH